MLQAAVLAFGLAILGGLYMASRIFRRQFAPWIVTAGHGLLVLLGVIIVITALITAPQAGPLLGWALGLFILAGAGGARLAYLHRRGIIAPRWLVTVHGFVAVLAFVMLVVATFVVPEVTPPEN